MANWKRSSNEKKSGGGWLLNIVALVIVVVLFYYIWQWGFGSNKNPVDTGSGSNTQSNAIRWATPNLGPAGSGETNTSSVSTGAAVNPSLSETNTGNTSSGVTGSSAIGSETVENAGTGTASTETGTTASGATATGTLSSSGVTTYENTALKYGFSIPKWAYYSGFWPRDGASHSMGFMTGTGVNAFEDAQVRLWYYPNKILPELQKVEGNLYQDPSANMTYIKLGVGTIRIEWNMENPIVTKIIETVHRED